MKKKILFGAGLYGHLALEAYTHENVAYFVDNNMQLVGQSIEGIEVISIDKLRAIYTEFDIVITAKYKEGIIKQLESIGIKNYLVYEEKDSRIYPTDELVVNPYDNSSTQAFDTSAQGREQRIKEIEESIEKLYKNVPLFKLVEIETINRCNGVCSFCPVSRNNDSREYKKMDMSLFHKIIDELGAINYSGRLALFSNNEPFLDTTILEKHRYARERLPYAKMHLYTNGTLLKIDDFISIIPYLDELIIDNYRQDLHLINNCKEIVKYCEQHIDLKKKVTIVLRKPIEILTNRGGDAPNRSDVVSYPNARCTLPFEQIIIRPDGKVSLCCNDPLGKNTLADLTKENIVDAWYNDRFKMVRKCLYEGGRKEWKHCMNCDNFSIV